MDENKYLQALTTGNQKLIEEVYHKFYPKIHSFILRNNGKSADAKDVFHDALLYLIAIQKEKTLEIQSFEGYLFTICKNMWRRSLKNKQEWVMIDDIAPPQSKETNLSRFMVEQARLDFYQEKFQLLSDNCKEILSSYFNNVGYDEIAKELAYSSINTVRQRVFKCKAKITKLIKEDPRFHKLNL